jgi:hypothetical protein
MVFRDRETEIERGVRFNRFCCCILVPRYCDPLDIHTIGVRISKVPCTAVIVMVKYSVTTSQVYLFD